MSTRFPTTVRPGPSVARAAGSRLAFFGALSISAFLAACGDDPTPPSSGTEADPRFEATLDPSGATFVLSRVVTGEPGLDLELVGANLSTDLDAGTVSLDVAIRNVSRRELAAPVTIWLSDFRPEGVGVANPDFVDPLDPSDDGSDDEGDDDPGDAGDDDGGAPVRFGFDYATAFGSDQALAPGETSSPRAWTFAVSARTSFSFAAVATFGSANVASLGGEVFNDCRRETASGIRGEDSLLGPCRRDPPGRPA